MFARIMHCIFINVCFQLRSDTQTMQPFDFNLKNENTNSLPEQLFPIVYTPKPETHQIPKPSLQNCRQSPCFTFSFQFYITLFAKHNTQFSTFGTTFKISLVPIESDTSHNAKLFNYTNWPHPFLTGVTAVAELFALEIRALALDTNDLSYFGGNWKEQLEVKE